MNKNDFLREYNFRDHKMGLMYFPHQLHICATKDWEKKARRQIAFLRRTRAGIRDKMEATESYMLYSHWKRELKHLRWEQLNWHWFLIQFAKWKEVGNVR